MPAPQLVELGRRLIANIEGGHGDLGDHIYQGPGSTFTDPDRLAREQEILFRRTPQIVGWAGEVSEPGDVLARTIAGVPVLVTMDADETIRAFLNACTHRGMGLCEGPDRARRLTCGYHGWTYDLGGTLVGVPARDRFPGLDTDALGLQPLPIQAQAGLLVVGLRPDVELDGFLDPMATETKWLGYDAYRGAAEVSLTKQANWKLMVDVNIEAYHVPSLHRQSLLPFLSDNCAVDYYGPHTRMSVPFKGLERLAGIPESSWPDRLDAIMVTTIFPSTVLIDHMEGGSMLQIAPGRHPGESTITIIEARPGPLDDLRRERCEETMKVNLSILDQEDFPAAESCQRGYDGGAISVIGGQGEPLIGHWHELWDAAVSRPTPSTWEHHLRPEVAQGS
jgi:carnitine monooxygenase subunit